MQRIIQGVLALSMMFSAAAGAQTADTVNGPKPLFTSGDALIFAGFTLATAAFARADRHFTHQLQVPARQANTTLKRGANIFRLIGDPGSILTGTAIYAIGSIDHQRRTQDLGLHTVESIVLANTITISTKLLAGRARPYKSPDKARTFQLLRGLKSDDYRSFPSGHTTSAFAFAAAVTSETQKWWPHSRWILGPILYGGATLTGISRIYNQQHWASDVMVGAAIGTFTGLHVVRFQHSHPGNWLDKKLLRAGIVIMDGGGWAPTLSTVSY